MKQPIGPLAHGAAIRSGTDVLASAAATSLNAPPIDAVEGRKTAGHAGQASTKPHGTFYLGSAAVLLLIVIVGFAPTFYLRAAFGAPEFSWRGVGAHVIPSDVIGG